MSILDGRRNNFMHAVAGVFKAIGVILAMWYVLSAEAMAGCGFVDVRLFTPPITSKFVDGGYTGFSTLAGKTIADCYASTLQENEKLGRELLFNLNSKKTTDEINTMRGLAPAKKLLVAHRGGPDWANGIPDNSVAAFQQSISRGVSSVEVDVQMDSKRNLIAYHDTSFSGMVKSNNPTLQADSEMAIHDKEWILKSYDSRKLDDSSINQLRRLIPNSFMYYGREQNNNITLKLTDMANEAKPNSVVSSLPAIISDIQNASEGKFGSKTAVNIFLDAAKSRDITIAVINRLRRSQMVSNHHMFNDIQSNLAVPIVESIAVQFRINHFPGGAEDLAMALCNSDENKITYKTSVVKYRRLLDHSYIMGHRYYILTHTSYTDSTDSFHHKYGDSVETGKLYRHYYAQATGKIYDNGNPPSRLWGDAASGTCNISDILNSGIALVPVVEETLPYKVAFYATESAKVLDIKNLGSGLENFLRPFKKYFNMNIIEFSYTPLDKVSYFLENSNNSVSTLLSSQDVYSTMALEFGDSVFPGQKYIYQTFNRFFDINLASPDNSPYNGQYLCSSHKIYGGTGYEYVCKNQVAGSTDEQKFEYRAKPGFYTGACNTVASTQFRALPFGLTTTDNPMLETYLQGMDFQNNRQLLADFCSTTNDGNRMSDYTTRYKSFVGNPSFRLSGGI